MPAEFLVKVPIRRIPVVIDLEDPLALETTLESFIETNRKEPDPRRYRIFNIEIITSPDDQQPMLVSECGRYSRFVRRERDVVYFRRELGDN